MIPSYSESMQDTKSLSRTWYNRTIIPKLQQHRSLYATPIDAPYGTPRDPSNNTSLDSMTDDLTPWFLDDESAEIVAEINRHNRALWEKTIITKQGRYVGSIPKSKITRMNLSPFQRRYDFLDDPNKPRWLYLKGGGGSSPSVSNSENLAYLTDFQLQLNNEGLFLLEMEKDGNCLFRSVADQLCSNQNEHGKFRKIAVDFISDHIIRYSNFMTLDAGTNCHDYVQKLAQEGTWGSHLL